MPLLPKGGKVAPKKKGGKGGGPRDKLPQVNPQKLSDQNKAILERKGWDAVVVLAHMEPQNIIQREFPKFDKAAIPQCRKDCKDFLKQTGNIGATVVVNQLVNVLMGQGRFERGIILSPAYEQDMLDVLGSHFASGRVSGAQIQALINATKGQKPDPRTARLAQMVQETVDVRQIALGTLIDLVATTTDRDFRDKLEDEFKRRLPTTPIDEQVALLSLRNPQLTPALQKRVVKSVLKDPDKLSTLGRLTVLTIPGIASVPRQTLLRELRAPSTLTRSQLDDLARILKLIDFADADVKKVAKIQAGSLYRQAPIKICLRDSLSADPKGSQFLWTVIDQKIERADDRRKTNYKKAAKAVLESPVLPTAQKREAIKLLEKMGAASVLAKSLMKIDGDLRIECGKALQRITGQTFGPSRAVSIIKLGVIQKKWLGWLSENPGFD